MNTTPNRPGMALLQDIDPSTADENMEPISAETDRRARRRLKHRSGADKASQSHHNRIAEFIPPINSLPVVDMDTTNHEANEQSENTINEPSGSGGYTRGRIKEFGCVGNDAVPMDFPRGPALERAPSRMLDQSTFSEMRRGRQKSHKSKLDRSSTLKRTSSPGGRLTSRKRHTNEHKMNILYEMEYNNFDVPEAVNRFNVPRTTLQNWIKCRPQIEKACETNAQSRTALRPGPLIQDRPDAWRDTMLCQYVDQRFAAGEPVERAEMVVLAKQVHDKVAEQLGVRSVFEATPSWLRTFLERVPVKCRNPTTRTTLTPAELVPLVLKNVESINKVIDDHRIPLSYVVNFDETCARMLGNMQVRGLQFIVPSGTSAIPVKKNKRETVAYTYMPIVAADGFQYPPVIIVNLKTVPEHLLDVIGRDNAWIIASGKSGSSWNTGELMIQILSLMEDFDRRLGRTGEKLAIFDNCSSHVTDDIIAAFHNSSFTPYRLPPNTTAHTQPLDVQWNSTFKHNLATLVAANPINYDTLPMAAARQRAIEYGVKACRMISKAATCAAFKAAGIGLARDGSEDHLWRPFQHGQILAAFDGHRAAWRATGIIHAVAPPLPIVIPQYEHSAHIQSVIESKREDYRVRMGEWNGLQPQPLLEHLPRQYYMAWNVDEPGAPPNTAQTERYDDRRLDNIVRHADEPPAYEFVEPPPEDQWSSDEELIVD